MICAATVVSRTSTRATASSFSAIYDLPFRGNRFVEGWQLAVIFQAQSGNPVNIVTTQQHGQRRGQHAAAGCDRADRNSSAA